MTQKQTKRSLKTLKNINFLKSAINTESFPRTMVPEIAIVGRSNAGKSSILNTICFRKQLAKTSKTPGKTQLLNFYSINEREIEIARLVDLPGYGYAKVDKLTKSFWNKKLLSFLIKRKNIIGIILVTDIRHPLGKLDMLLLENLISKQVFFHVLFNKSDKIKRSSINFTVNHSLDNFLNKLPEYSNKVSFSLFSTLKRNGIEELTSIIDSWIKSSIEIVD